MRPNHLSSPVSVAALSLIAAAVAAGHGVSPGVNAADSAPVTLSPANVRLASTVLTVAGNTTVVNIPMNEELGGALCSPPNVCQTVVYPSGDIGGIALQKGVAALTTDINTTPGKKVVFAYSQGGMIVTSWLQDSAASATAPPKSDLTFVLLGNPQRGLNGQAPTLGVGSATPTDTGYTVIDVSREYDGESDWPNNPLNGWRSPTPSPGTSSSTPITPAWTSRTRTISSRPSAAPPTSSFRPPICLCSNHSG